MHHFIDYNGKRIGHEKRKTYTKKETKTNLIEEETRLEPYLEDNHLFHKIRPFVSRP